MQFSKPKPKGPYEQRRGRSFLFGRRRPGQGSGDAALWKRNSTQSQTPREVKYELEQEAEQKSQIVQMAKSLPNGIPLYLHLTQVMEIHKGLGFPRPLNTSVVFHEEEENMETTSSSLSPVSIATVPEDRVGDEVQDIVWGGHDRPRASSGGTSTGAGQTSSAVAPRSSEGNEGQGDNPKGQNDFNGQGQDKENGQGQDKETGQGQDGEEVGSTPRIPLSSQHERSQRQIVGQGDVISATRIPATYPGRSLAEVDLGSPRPLTQGVYYNQANVKQIDVPSFSGAFGILPSHVPTLAVLKPGVVTVYEQDGSSKKFFVSSGSVTVNDDSSVQVLAEEAVPLDQLDASAAREALTQAQAAVGRASGDKEKAEAQIAVEVAEALVEASK